MGRGGSELHSPSLDGDAFTTGIVTPGSHAGPTLPTPAAVNSTIHAELLVAVAPDRTTSRSARLWRHFQRVAGTGRDQLDLLFQAATFDFEAVRDVPAVMDDKAHRPGRDGGAGQFDLPFSELHLNLGWRRNGEAQCSGWSGKVEQKGDERHRSTP